ncbi:MAG: hypothetical protein C0595_04615 [Marinilabiliales bacterium]|nr:MAG: hypothetical protein C0595_04615 [Marinilabiliales bacterium]
MKYYTLLSSFLLICFYCCCQDTINNNKLEFTGSITIDNVSNISGGIKKGNNTLGLLDVNTWYRINKGVLKNIGFNIHLLKTTNAKPSENLIGDIQTVSNIEGNASRFFYELLINYKINKFSITTGLHDLNSEFNVSENALNFINSSFGIFPVVSLNIPTSIFPITTFGAVISYNTKKFDIAGGVYNLNYDFVENNSFKFDDNFYQKGYFAISEFRYRWFNGSGKTAEIKAGGFYKKGKHEKDLSYPSENVSENNYGLYLVGDFKLKEFSSNRELLSFVQIGHAPTRINLSSEYYGLGFSIISHEKKYFPSQIGLAVAYVKLNDLVGDKFVNSGRYESTIELTSKINFLNYFILQPDVQYIISPSGGLYNNSLAAILRLIVNFTK